LSRDVVRHKLVQHIVTAYSRYDEARNAARTAANPNGLANESHV
jgi:phosphate starvation-inducible protein PhoH